MSAVPSEQVSVAPSRRYVEQVMGMPLTLALRGRHATDARGQDAWAAVLEQLGEVDRVFSTYRPDSWISRLARCEVDVVDCPSEVEEVLGLAELAREQSGGAFDVTRPDRDDLDGPGVLDPSGVVKGWAVERASALLAGLSETDWCLSAGGDMTCHVADPLDPAWRIGIEHPHDPSRLVAVVPLRTGAIATSGLTHRGSHIIDPRTGEVPTALASVTVVAASLTWADIDATAAFVLGDDALVWLASRPGRTGVVVTADGVAHTFASRA